MITTKIKYSPSINIIRDNEYEFNYISTPNATIAFSNILNDALTGIKSHILIGAYGSGKSSFLLAFKQTLEGHQIHFKGFKKLLTSIPNYEFITLVGEFDSFEKQFAQLYDLGNNYASSDIIKALDKHSKSNKKKGKGLAILVDEFGKFLEYAAKNSPESELYFIQQFSEWANDSRNDTLFISTLHQDFSNYALQLNALQRDEWNKVKGRIKDIPFNEPVEQLLFLASERIHEKFAKTHSINKTFDKLFECIQEAKAFPLKDYFEKNFAKKLYPFDILSASILTLALQKYGQHERSLFSFIESNDHLGINDFNINEDQYYSIPKVYDYLINAYYSNLSSRYNPHYTQWSAIRRAMEKIDGLFTDINTQKQAEDIIKLIGLLNIFATASAKLEPRFYFNYAKLALGIKNPEEILRELDKKKVIRYVNHNFRYILFEGTDLDIEIAIDEAGRLVEKVSNIVGHLNEYFEFPFISAKAVYYEKGTPRFFQFKLTEDPINITPEGEIDGFINLIFADDAKAVKKVESSSINCKEAILYGYYKNTAEIKNLLFEIQKIKKVKENNLDDKVAQKELNSILEHYIKLLNHYVLDNLYADNGNVIWYYKGVKRKITNRQKFNQLLSEICEDVYPDTPVFKNELINKTKFSAQISTARKKLIDQLLENIDKENIGFDPAKFPPEKSIYLTLLRETGIHLINDNLATLERPTDLTLHALWDTGIAFLNSTKDKERKLTEFIDILSTRPFKLKQGFIDFWLPIFLLAKIDDFALFENDSYIPEITKDIFDLINKRPGMFYVKAFDVVGIKLKLFNRYRVFLNQSENQQPNNKAFIQTIKPFLAFYRELSEYSKKTNRLDKKTLALRQVIANAKDPEKAFFEDFPTALGYSLSELQTKPDKAEAFIKQLQKSIRELRTSYDGLLDRYESYLINDVISIDLEFPDYKEIINNRYKGLKAHLLLPNQKAFYNRLQSQMDDRKAWLAAVAQSCLGKSLLAISDDDEILLHERTNDLVYELDNLTEIGNEEVDINNEEVLKLEITSLMKGSNKNLLRIPGAKTREINDQMQKIKTNLGKDKKMNIAALAKILQELLQND